MPEGLSQFQQGKMAEREWREGTELENQMAKIREAIDKEFKGDIFATPADRLQEFKEKALAYQKRGHHNDRLDRLAQELISLPVPEPEAAEK